jgi:hypothetical protein
LEEFFRETVEFSQLDSNLRILGNLRKQGDATTGYKV